MHNNITKKRNIYKGIEMFRGLAAVMVVIYHVSRMIYNEIGTYPFSYITEFGHVGVDFFFVLSGFIIMYVHFDDINRKEKLKNYIKKRLIRIFPIFWVVVVIYLILTPFMSEPTFPDFYELFNNLFLIPDNNYKLIVGPSWSLRHEILFYFIFGVFIYQKKLVS